MVGMITTCLLWPQQVVNVSPKGLKPLASGADISKPEDCNRLIDETIKSFES